MRIALLNDQIPPENRGGAGIVVWRLAHALQDMGHDVHVIASTQGTSFEEIREGIPTYHIHAKYPKRFWSWLSLYNPQVIQPLRKLFQRIQPDVINGHNVHWYLTYHALTLAYKMGIATVFSSHDVMPFAYAKLTQFIKPNDLNIPETFNYTLPADYNRRTQRFRYNPFRNQRIRHVLSNHVQVRTAVSHALSQAHQDNGLPPFDVVHNAIDEARFTVADTQVQAFLERLDLLDRKVILFAGRLTLEKGTHQILAALDDVVKQVPEAILLVLSPRSLDEQVPERYAHLKVNHMRSGGWLDGDELTAAFYASDAVVVPSICFDSFPTINLEAMIAQVPILATCFGGSREAILDGKTGYVINPFNTVYFAEKLIHILENGTLSQQMGQAGREHINTHFTMKHQVNAMLDVYKRAIQTLKSPKS